ncbi:diguanylate cyclase domain-containing protein [Roseateles cellulosilyticus]|uniref:diguanylate cyclase n=1 Tax=Pelomonas cellulosilytica TaxID=2906762 RepID=A0ABS8XPH6_9BURK|nr:diguanylate cyclase [Pelomonas sp. P8]MCE4553733.1 diguanylate cyclase [Pelomonas sp. P8]
MPADSVAVITDAYYPYHRAVISGVLDVLAARGMAATLYIGKELDTTDWGLGQASGLYDRIDPAMHAGTLVLASTLGKYVSDARLMERLAHLSARPLVMMARDVPSCQRVLVDDRSGMRALMEHLIVGCGRRRFVLMSGLKGHPDSDARESAVREALAEHGVELPEERVAYGGFWSADAREGMQRILQRTRDIDAVVCLNDPMAFAVIEVLQQAGLRVPEDVAVTGFDDTVDAQFNIPPLTTVRQPLAQLGRRAAEALLDRIAGLPPAAERLVLDTELRVRRSCGSPVSIWLRSLMEEDAGDAAPAWIEARLREAAHHPAAAAALQHDWETLLLDGLGRRDDQHALRRHVERAAQRVAATLDAPGRARLHEMLASLYPVFSAVEHFAYRMTHFHQLRHDRFASENMALLGSRQDLHSVLDGCAWYIRNLGLSRYFLATFEPAAEGAPRLARLRLASSPGATVDDGAPYPASQLLPDTLAHELARGHLFVYPLCCADAAYGLILFDAPPGWDLDHEGFAGALSAALHQQHQRAALEAHAQELEAKVRQRTEQLQREVDVRRRAEQALDAANQELRRLAFMDGLTGVANRAAFQQAMTVELAQHRRNGLPLGLILCDVDFFKRYNDHYGHLQGDDCLRRVAQALQQAARRPRDVAARYGGEEFVLLLPETDEAGVQTVARTIREAMDRLAIPHTTSDAASHVTLSLGTVSLRPGPDTLASDLVQAADDALYRAKAGGRNQAVMAPSPPASAG